MFAEYYYTEPMTKHSRQVKITKPQQIKKDKKDATNKIECILVDNQNMLLVLFRHHQCIQDECVTTYPHNSYEKYSQLEVEFSIK